MRQIALNLKSKQYSVFVGIKDMSELCEMILSFAGDRRIFLITNTRVAALYLKRLAKGIEKALKPPALVIADGEKHKNLRTANKLYTELIRQGCTRRDMIIAFGGGVIGDLVGFVAATLNRGVPYIQLPSTLLAQVDSSIGGKVGVDHRLGKNLIGAFYNPEAVLSYQGFLKTLAPGDMKNGFAEIIKYGAISDPQLIDVVEEKGQLIQTDEDLAAEIVYRCASIKARVVEQDELELSGERMILNFGHTIGHALEALYGYKKLAHGMAISIGMVIAGNMSVLLGLLEKPEKDRLQAALTRVGLPTSLPRMDPAKILEFVKRDKKFGKKNRFVLLKSLGKPVIMEDVPTDVVVRAIEMAYTATHVGK